MAEDIKKPTRFIIFLLNQNLASLSKTKKDLWQSFLDGELRLGLLFDVDVEEVSFSSVDIKEGSAVPTDESAVQNLVR